MVMCRHMVNEFGVDLCAKGHWRMKSLSRFLILFGLSILLLPASMAEAKGNGRVTGNIRSMSGSPLRDAVIKVIEAAQQGEALLVARSDSRGFFKSANLNPGDYYLEVTRPGYQTVTTDRFTIDPGRTTSLDIVLQEFIGYISNNDDPRNWNLKTVMRSSSDRRLIFRGLSDDGMPVEKQPSPFYRSGAMNIASYSASSGSSYLIRPQSSQTGITSNFAITEPVSPHSRMILSGQADFGGGAFWRLRNTYNYRPDDAHDYRISMGYGRVDLNYPGSASVTSRVLPGHSEYRQAGVETIALGLEGSTQLLDLLSVKYGLDYSRFNYGTSKSFFYPSIQILITPMEGWSVRTSFTSRRSSDTNSVVLPDGEVLDLSEPTIITMVGDRVSMSQVTHSEISVQREMTPDTGFEVAVYQDRLQGQGLPLMVTTITPEENRSRVMEIGEDHSLQRGLRVTINRKILDRLNGSLAYGYGTATSLSDIDGFLSSGALNGNLLRYTRQQYQHAITGQLDAIIPLTKTNLRATVRWYPGNPLTPIDWFSDRMDIGTKSTNLEIRQAFPLPEFMGNAGHWEILIDLRNILNQGKEVMPIPDGEIALNRNPRSMRFGLNLNFR